MHDNRISGFSNSSEPEHDSSFSSSDSYTRTNTRHFVNKSLKQKNNLKSDVIRVAYGRN